MVKQITKEKQIIYFDTSVLLDYLLLKRGFTQVNSQKKFDISALDPDKTEVLISNINIIELSEKLRDAKATEIALGEGCSYFELTKQNIDKIELTADILTEIKEEIQTNLLDLPVVAGTEPKGFSGKEIGELTEFCANHSVFMIDAMHFMIADREGCSLFVTSDIPLHNSLKAFISKVKVEDSIKIITGKCFKNNHLSELSK
jgi:hypothetical protein